MMPRSLGLIALTLAGAATGCASRPHTAPAIHAFQEPFGDPYPHAKGPRQALGDQSATIGVTVDATLAARCKLPGAAVYFEFDSSDLGLWSQEQLAKLATCVTSGAAAGEGIEIIGRADPRGTDEYNYDLGMDRAESVASFLRGRGIPEERVLLVSRGEQAASPGQPWRWATDRRVTLRLHDGDAVAPTAETAADQSTGQATDAGEGPVISTR